MIVVSEYSPRLSPSASANDIRQMTETAELLGLKTYYIPQLFEDFSVEDALQYIPTFAQPETAFWVGYIPSPTHYEQVYQTLVTKNIYLVNNPEEFQLAEELDKYYPLIKDLTCKSFIVETLEEAQIAGKHLGFPVFLKGTIQSFKKYGWKACVAENETELENLFSVLYKHYDRSLGKVIIRELMNLRYSQTTNTGFPQGREYRVFLFHQEIIGYSYYWSVDDILSSVTPEEEKIIQNLAIQAARLINVPYVAIDIGQLESGEWLVIEAGDAQFSGICQIETMKLWQKLIEKENAFQV